MALQTLNQQAAVLAYRDVFAYCAVAAFCIVPVTLLFEAAHHSAAAAPSRRALRRERQPGLETQVQPLVDRPRGHAWRRSWKSWTPRSSTWRCRTSRGPYPPRTTRATWTLTSYLVANGIVLPISGFFGNRLGRKRYFLICIGMFACSRSSAASPRACRN